MPALLALRPSSRSISGSCIASASRIGPLLATAWILIRSVQSTQPSLAPNLQCSKTIRCFEDLEMIEGNVRLASQDQETAVRSEEADAQSTEGEVDSTIWHGEDDSFLFQIKTTYYSIYRRLTF